MRLRRILAPTVWLALAACGPSLDWREFTDATSGVRLALPCRPQRLARTVSVAGRPLRLEMLSCSAGGATWGVASGDVGDPAHVQETLAALSAAARRNVDAAPAEGAPAVVAGSTPNPQALRHHFVGHMPDGRPVTDDVMVFAKGTRVFQAAVLAGQVPSEAVEQFLSALRVER